MVGFEAYVKVCVFDEDIRGPFVSDSVPIDHEVDKKIKITKHSDESCVCQISKTNIREFDQVQAKRPRLQNDGPDSGYTVTISEELLSHNSQKRVYKSRGPNDHLTILYRKMNEFPQ